MKYKSTNVFSQPIRVEGRVINPGESIIVDSKIEGFHNEQIEEKKSQEKMKGGK